MSNCDVILPVNKVLFSVPQHPVSIYHFAAFLKFVQALFISAVLKYRQRQEETAI
jgi:hypothetical protein